MVYFLPERFGVKLTFGALTLASEQTVCSSRVCRVCSNEGLTLKMPTVDQTSRAKNIPYQPLLIKPHRQLTRHHSFVKTFGVTNDIDPTSVASTTCSFYDRYQRDYYIFCAANLASGTLSVKPVCQYSISATVFYLSGSKSPECVVSIIHCLPINFWHWYNL